VAPSPWRVEQLPTNEEGRDEDGCEHGRASKGAAEVACLISKPEVPERISPEMPVRPDSFYGVGKACGENLGRLYADKHGLQVVCVRIGTFAERPTTPRHLSTWLSPRDAVELFWRCLVAPDIGFTVVYGTSATQRGWWDPGPVEQLGYRPVDDAETWASEVNGADADRTSRVRVLRAAPTPAESRSATGQAPSTPLCPRRVWASYGAPAAGSRSSRSISSAACRSCVAWKCA
jgi:hypothetical protein